MFILLPKPIEGAKYVSSTIAEPDATQGETNWNAATNYTVGDQVIRTTTHRKYANKIAGVSATLPEIDPTRWEDIGPTNKWALVDGYIDTQTVATGQFTLVVTPGTTTEIGILGIKADAVEMTARKTPGGDIYDTRVFSLDDYSGPDLMWEFYFGEQVTRDRLLIQGIFPWATCEITLRFYNTILTNPVAVGIVAFGSLENLGIAQHGFKAKPTDLSTIDLDKYGQLRITKLKAAKDLTGECIVPAGYGNSVMETIYKVLSVPVLAIPSLEPRYDWLYSFGLLSAEQSTVDDVHDRLTIDLRGII